MKYPNVKAGQWVQPRRKGYKMACCDCGLVHRLDFRVVKGRIQMRGYRDKRATASVRRAMPAEKIDAILGRKESA